MALPTPAHDCTALVTGASSGIGVEIARELARRGHGVTLLARRTDRLQELAAELTLLGVRAETLDCDLADRDARAALPGRLEALGLTVEVLVNNAGLSTVGPVLNVASTASFQPLPGQAGYGASKAFVRSYTQALDTELRGTGVSASALCPGPVETEFGDVAGFDLDETKAAMPSVMWETPAAVAKVGVDAMANGTQVAIPGTVNRIAAMASQAAPKRLLLPVLAKQHPGLKK